MEKAIRIIDEVANLTDRAVLFHSATGKDSIALLSMLAPRFKEVICAFMYVVKDLEHIDRYISWARKSYPNVRFIQVPHYALGSYRKEGFMGCRKDPKQRQFTLAQLTDLVREKTGVEWAFFGFKQSDGLNRRVMLRTYREEAINDVTKKAYPLSKYKNADVLAYIERNDLIRPEHYGDEYQSSGADITSVAYLGYLRDNYPRDYEKVLREYPACGTLMYRQDNEDKGE